MFTITPLTDLKVKERNIFKMLYSMNSPQVATPELSVEEARCYVLFFSEGPNLSAYIGLYLPRIDRKIFYSYTANPFPFEAAPDVEFEATGFAEDMGFLLDEISVSGMPVDDRNRWIEEQFIFGYKKPDLGEEFVTVSNEKVKSALTEKGEDGETKVKEEQTPIAAAEEPVEQVPVPKADPIPHLQEPALHQEPAQPQKQAVSSVQPQPPILQQPQIQPQQQTAPPVQQQPSIQQPYVQPPQQPLPAYQQPIPQQVQPYMPIQPNGQPQQYQQPFPQQGQPMMPQYPSTPPPQAPVLEQPSAPPKKAQPPLQAKAPTKKKVQKAPQPLQEESFEETAPIELEMEPAHQRPANVFEEALRAGVVKPPKTRTPKTTRTAAGVVTRDKEALARLLASF